MKFSIKFFCLTSLLSFPGVLSRHVSSSPTKKFFAKTTNLRTPAFLSKKSSTNTKQLAKDIGGIPRGGSKCSDSDPVLFLKIGTTAIFESAALFGILWASIKISASDVYPSWIPSVFNEPLLELLASFLVIFGSSLVGSIVGESLGAATNQVLDPVQVPGDQDWYLNLNKPSWNPPGWLFPIMWLIVSKPTQLCAISRMLKFGDIGGGNKDSILALLVYTTHLALGNAWNEVFFNLQCIGRGTFVISLFFGALLASTYLFYNIDKVAGYYMLPTCGWVAVATALQYSINSLNKNKK
jgi:tryptophan-rich sensory protein